MILETGRKHQIRVHAEWLDKRVVGDKIYGPEFTAPVQEDMLTFCQSAMGLDGDEVQQHIAVTPDGSVR